eukprot:CAMPEP_0113725896 /NCGR_PEP_ID=MMETSP0038_2-20120614/40067_1 /TAXON_ID=2898 /ORGANISM="Cryptomonas paramecium" /LENGTH=48 /DNA_ID=CAMNT_0000656315 /DNA_START=182 /DNA_END=325 /DNA_ORIENTATION=+ /assembly_acc=CAM_ASM_000170
MTGDLPPPPVLSREIVASPSPTKPSAIVTPPDAFMAESRACPSRVGLL